MFRFANRIKDHPGTGPAAALGRVSVAGIESLDLHTNTRAERASLLLDPYSIFQVFLILFAATGGCDRRNRNLLDDLDAKAFQSGYAAWVISQQSNTVEV